VALVGLLLSLPVLVLGSLCSRLLTLGPAAALDGIARPLAYVLDPLQRAYEADHDLGLFGYLALQALLLLVLWARVGGTLCRLAAVDLTTSEREESRAACAFSRKHRRAFLGARLALWVGFGAPLAAIALLGLTGRIPGWPGAVLLALAIGAGVVLALVAALVGSCWAVAGFLQGPTIACEDSDAFDALSRTFGYAAAGLPRVVRVRFLFFTGVLLGTAWRALKSAVALLLGWACLRLGAGAEVLDRALAILSAGGTPHDADRLGVVASDHVVAFALAAAVGYVLLTWLADLVVRVVCGRTAAYLVLREAIDGVPVRGLHTAPKAPPFRTAAEAGFEEAGRVGAD
jgi:hypothetical protein